MGREGRGGEYLVCFVGGEGPGGQPEFDAFPPTPVSDKEGMLANCCPWQSCSFCKCVRWQRLQPINWLAALAPNPIHVCKRV